MIALSDVRALALVLGLSATLVAPGVRAEEAPSEDTYKYIELFGNVFERVRREYVEEVTDQKLIESAINGMLSDLDPHSSYLSADDFENMKVQTRGEFGGLGIEVTMENGWVKVVSPIDETPAFDAGIQAGDLIIAIDGETVNGLTLNDAVDKMRGPVGTDITITVNRDGRETFDVTLTRANIKIRSVRWRTEDDEVGYIRITSFNEQTQSGLEKGIDEIQRELGSKLIGYVLDLRNNPGGLLDQAVSVADTFLDQGEIVSTRARRPEDTQRYNARRGDLTNGKPVVVLINDGSASASEIVAGALKDHRRAILLGTKTFGKGSVQTIMPLNETSAMRLTTARYYTPSGKSIQTLGIEPDINVPLARIDVLESDIKRSESRLRGALANDQLTPKAQNGGEDADKPAKKPAGTPADKDDGKGSGKDGHDADGAENGEEGAATGGYDPKVDYQLVRAIDLLRGIHLYAQKQ